MDEELRKKAKAVRLLFSEMNTIEWQIQRIDWYLGFKGVVSESVDLYSGDDPGGTRMFDDVVRLVPKGTVKSLVDSYARRRRDELMGRYVRIVDLVYGALKDGEG